MARFDEFWNTMCSFRDYFWLGVMVMLFFFFLDAFALVFGQWGTPSYRIAIFNMVMILGAGGTMLWMFIVCDRRAERSYESKSTDRED